MTKPFDFDVWYDENAAPEKPTRPFRLAHRLWQIPVDVPAAALLRIDTMRRRLDELSELDPEQVLPPEVSERIQADIEAAQPAPMLRAMIGDTLVDQWIGAGLTERRLGVVAVMLYQHYSGETSLDEVGAEAEADADAEGKASSPTTDPDATSSPGSTSTGT